MPHLILVIMNRNIHNNKQWLKSDPIPCQKTVEIICVAANVFPYLSITLYPSYRLLIWTRIPNIKSLETGLRSVV